jgi:hypothetical protein
MGRTWRCIGRVCEKDESSRFRNLLRKRVVKYEAVHSPLPFRNRKCPRRHLVCFVFAIPLYRNEAFGSQLFLGCRLVVLRCIRWASQLFEASIEMNKGVGSIIQMLWGWGIARSRMFEYSKVSAY